MAVMKYKEAEKYYKALANNRRIAILHFLYKAKEATVGEMSSHIKLSFKSTSKHIQKLKSVGFITSRQINLEQHYEICKPHNIFIKHLLSILLFARIGKRDR